MYKIHHRMRMNGRNGTDGVVTRLPTEQFEVEFRKRWGVFLYSKIFRPTLGPIQPLHWIMEVLFLERNWPEREKTTKIHLMSRLKIGVYSVQ